MTVCKINTQEPEETLDFDFCSTNVINKIILQSEGLREAFSELDMTSEVLQITMSPDKPYFRYLKALQSYSICLLTHLLRMQSFCYLGYENFQNFRELLLLLHTFMCQDTRRPRKTNSLFKARYCWFLEE